MLPSVRPSWHAPTMAGFTVIFSGGDEEVFDQSAEYEIDQAGLLGIRDGDRIRFISPNAWREVRIVLDETMADDEAVRAYEEGFDQGRAEARANAGWFTNWLAKE
jgi:hypothetical protein